MSGKAGSRTAMSHPGVPPAATAPATGSSKDASARWAALDSRYERLVTASDAVLTDCADRKDGLKAAS